MRRRELEREKRAVGEGVKEGAIEERVKREKGSENLLKGSIFVGWEKNNHGNFIRRKPKPEAGQKRYQ